MLVAFSVAPVGVAAPAAGAPVGEEQASCADAVADAVAVVRESGLPHRTDAMFTTIEGDWDACMDVVRRACDAVARHGARVSLVLKADLRPGPTGELVAKPARLEAALARRQVTSPQAGESAARS